MNILNDKDLKIKDISESHKNIDKEDLENIIKKQDIKKACGGAKSHIRGSN